MTTEAKRVYLQNENDEILLPYSAQALEDGAGNVISETYLKKTELDNCYKPPLLSFMWSDHLLNDMPWLRADTFSWQDGTTYSLVYDELLSEYNNSASTTETEGSITFKRTPKGYKIALADQETAILNKYNSNGIAWYYILDPTNQRFKLPRMKHKYWKDQSTIPVMGNGIALGFTNGTYNVGARTQGSSGYLTFLQDAYGQPISTTASAQPAKTGTFGVTTDPTKSGIVADVSDVNIETGFYLYFYVGGFTKSAEAQTAGLNSELLNAKVDLNFNNMNPSQTAKNIIAGWSMPSSKFIDLTLGGNGSEYTAPANGYFSWSGFLKGTVAYCVLYNKTTRLGTQSFSNYNAETGVYGFCFVPVSKGDIVTWTAFADSLLTTTSFRFVYAEGAKND